MMESSLRDNWTIAIFLARRTNIGQGESPFVDLPGILRLRSVVDDTTSTQALLGE